MWGCFESRSHISNPGPRGMTGFRKSFRFRLPDGPLAVQPWYHILRAAGSLVFVQRFQSMVLKECQEDSGERGPPLRQSRSH